MRLLITTPFYAPQLNGVAQVVQAHVQHFVRAGHQVTVATGFDPAREPTPPGANPTVVQFHVTGCAHPRAPFRGQVQAYQEFLRGWVVDVIMCHCWQIWSTDLAVPCLGSHPARTVLVSHGFSAHVWPKIVRFPRGLVTWLGWRPYVWRAVRRMKQFDRVVFLSDLINRGVYYDAWLARRHGLSHTCVIPSGVHVAEFDEPLPDFRQAYGLGSEPMVLCVCNYDPWKNPLLVLQAFAQAAVKPAVLVFIGSVFTDYTTRMRQWYQQAGGESTVGRVIFLEKLHRSMVKAAYRAADLFVYGSLWESGPLVILEAMAARTAFVSVDVGFVSKLPGGWVVRSLDEMAQAIRTLLLDEPRRQQLAQAGRAACEQTYDWAKIMPRYDALLASLAQPKGSRPSAP